MHRGSLILLELLLHRAVLSPQRPPECLEWFWRLSRDSCAPDVQSSFCNGLLGDKQVMEANTPLLQRKVQWPKREPGPSFLTGVLKVLLASCADPPGVSDAGNPGMSEQSRPARNLVEVA